MTLPHFRGRAAVPQHWPVRLEIIKAIRTLAAQERQDQEVRKQQRQVHDLVLRRDCELALEALHGAWRECARLLGQAQLRKAGFNPNEPRVPAGNPDGGRWTRAGGDAASGPSMPANKPAADVRVASDTPGIGHNQGPPLEEPPKIPPELPATKQAINSFLKTAAYWLVSAAARADKRIALFLAALQAVQWLSQYRHQIDAYLDPPKTLEELQEAVINTKPGYDVHHIVEQTPAAQDGFPESAIEAPENKVGIPRLRHRQITAWFQTKNPDFDDLSPRDYLRGKSWDERVRVGKYALILFGVLKP